MYIKIGPKGEKIFPYDLFRLKKEFPNTSFPKDMSEELLSTYNIFLVKGPLEGPPEPNKTKKTELSVRQENQTWVAFWEEYPLSDAELEFAKTQKETVVRQERDGRLRESDWTQLLDSPVDKTQWATYRESLRQVPQQQGFPWKVVWPKPPKK
jgi:hypothetical protein